MSYEYTDQHGYKLTVMPCPNAPGGPRVGIDKSEEDDWQLLVKPEDAPAVALAILAAAGVKRGSYLFVPPTDEPESLLSCAAQQLWRFAEYRTKQAEREAEDAKVREFVESIPGVSYLDESEDHWRHLYRAAREFFANDPDALLSPTARKMSKPIDLEELEREIRDEKPAPRTLRYGDPEPDRDTKWRDSGGEVWERLRSGWCCDGDPDDVWEWRNLSRSWFPMTEVTE